jgi:hypothetical protein
MFFIYFQLMSLSKCISVLSVSTINSLQAVYVYNMTSALKEFIKINERFFSHFKVGHYTLLCSKDVDCYYRVVTIRNGVKTLGRMQHDE